MGTLTVALRPRRLRVALVLAAGLTVVVAFQAAIASGAPLGFAAQGGANAEQLPAALRLVAGIAAVGWLVAVLVVLSRGGGALFSLPHAVDRAGIWVVVVLLGAGVLVNLASSSPWERYGWAPYALVMFGLSVVLARSGPASDRSPEASTVAMRRGPVSGAAS